MRGGKMGDVAGRGRAVPQDKSDWCPNCESSNAGGYLMWVRVLSPWYGFMSNEIARVDGELLGEMQRLALVAPIVESGLLLDQDRRGGAPGNETYPAPPTSPPA